MIPPDVGLAWGTIADAGLIETIEVAARHGFPTLQIPPNIYFDALETGLDARTLRRCLADAGVKVRVVDGISDDLPGLSAEPVMFKGRPMRFDIAMCIETALALEAPIISVSHYLGKPVLLEIMADAIGRACRQVAQDGIAIVLEFIPDSGIRTLGEAQAIAEACGEPNCAILLDVWHLSRSGGSPADIRALPPGAIGAFQLSDRKAPPPDTRYVPGTGRLLLGQGELPLGEIVSAALDNSPGITLEAEIFSEELGALSADAAAARTAAAVKAWQRTLR